MQFHLCFVLFLWALVLSEIKTKTQLTLSSFQSYTDSLEAESTGL